MRGRWRGGPALAGVAVLGVLAGPGCTLVRRAEPPPVTGGMQDGIASWYGPGFHGRRTANGEVFDQHELTAAHRSLPHGTRVMVTNLTNGRSVEVRINDRGPFIRGRVIDLSYAAARSIAMIGPGTAPVRIEVLAPAGAAAQTRAQLVPPPPNDLPATSYAIQVASLTDAGKAEQLRQVLARRFPDAFVSPLAGSQRRYYRVRIGPYPLRQVALARAELVNRLGYPAVIMEDDGR
jgi:rare lipoprotein A